MRDDAPTVGQGLTRRQAIAVSLVGLTGAGPHLATAQTAPAAPLLDAAALAQDAAIAERALRTLHPGLGRYNTPAQVDALFASFARSYGQARDLSQAHLALARLAAGVRCGHTFVNPFNQEGACKALIDQGANRLPFRFSWMDGRMIVSRDYAPAHLAAGDEIVAIAGRRTSQLLVELLALAPADGSNDARRRRVMELDGTERWPLFDIYAPLILPALNEARSTRLLVRGAGGERTVECPLWDRAQRLADNAGTARPEAKTSGAPLWAVEHLPGGVAWLTMPTWSVYDSKWDWKGALNADLDGLAEAKARALVLDLRGNAGGLDVGNLVLARCVDKDLPLARYRRFTRYRTTPPDLDRYLETWDRSFRNWGEDAQGPDAQGFYRLVRYDDDANGDVIAPAGRRLKARLIVLTDAANSSATFQFADAVKTHGLGTLVGETTGGSRRGINGGAFFFLRLPGSGLEVDLPLIATFPQTPQPDAGVTPDVPVRRTIADVRAGRDPVREAALRLALS